MIIITDELGDKDVGILRKKVNNLFRVMPCTYQENVDNLQFPLILLIDKDFRILLTHNYIKEVPKLNMSFIESLLRYLEN